jgi:hypothetical protein
VPEPRALPHDLYITAVVNALTKAGLEPDDHWTSDAEINRYDGGPDAGCTTMLNAYLDWDTSAARDDGIALVWDHPAEQWQWAPRKSSGVLAHDPEFLPTLPRWARPGAVVATVRDLLAGRAVSTMPSGLWEEHEQAQAAVDAWAASES